MRIDIKRLISDESQRRHAQLIRELQGQFGRADLDSRTAQPILDVLTTISLEILPLKTSALSSSEMSFFQTMAVDFIKRVVPSDVHSRYDYAIAVTESGVVDAACPLKRVGLRLHHLHQGNALLRRKRNRVPMHLFLAVMASLTK